MDKQESQDTGRLIGALLTGAVVGAALGILFAPAEGRETRRKLANYLGFENDLFETGDIKDTNTTNQQDPEKDRPV